MITIFQACSSGDTNIVLKNMRHLSKNGFGTTLHVACTHGNIEAVKLLIRGGAPLNSLDEGGMTPLQRARDNGSHEVIKIILEAKRDLDD